MWLQRHLADGASARLGLDDLRMHWAGIRRTWRGVHRQIVLRPWDQDFRIVRVPACSEGFVNLFNTLRDGNLFVQFAIEEQDRNLHLSPINQGVEIRSLSIFGPS